jgi:membrane protein YqaA with SNARE-associated domain
MVAPLSPLALFAAAAAGHKLLHILFRLGLLGLFVVSCIDSSFIPLPVPGVTDIMIVVYAAAHANVFLLVIIATAGSAVGGLFSHAAGQAGGMAFLEKHVPAAILKRVTAWMESHAILSVAVPAILPPPMPLSAFVLAAGAVHMSRKKFMTAFVISRFCRHAIAAWLGIHYGKAVLRFWSHFSEKWGTTILIVLWSSILLFTAIAAWRLYKTSKTLNLRSPGKQRAAAPTP